MAKKPYIVAEIAQGYEGSAKLVELFVKTAAACRADAVKFQIFKADELAMPDYQYYGLFKSLELTDDVWKAAVAKAHELGIAIFSDVFGTTTLRVLEELGFDGYKIHTTDINNTGLLSAVAATGKKVLLSTGGCNSDEVKNALMMLKKCDVTLMYGFQAEPTELDDNNLARISTILRTFNLPVGFQDHTAGDSPYAAPVSYVALGLGATVFEKHLTLSRPGQLEDFVSALNPDEFVAWAESLIELSKTLGSSEWVLTAKESTYRRKVRRAVIASQALQPGDTIQASVLTFKRTAAINAIYDINAIINRVAGCSIPADVVITKEMLK